MSALDRFENHQILGFRKNMKSYDVKNQKHLDELLVLIEKHEALKNNLIQTFAPDTLDEAKNRGFKPLS